MSKIINLMNNLELSGLTLNFKNVSDQQSYVDDNRDTILKSKRNGILWMILFCLVVGVFDFFQLKDVNFLVLFARLGIFIPFAVLMYAISYTDKFYQYIKYIMPATSFACMLSYIVAMNIAGNDLVFYQMGIIPIFILCTGLLSYDFVGSSISILAGYGFYLSSMSNYQIATSNDTKTIVTIVGIVVIMSIAYTYYKILNDKLFYYKMRNSGMYDEYDEYDSYEQEESVVKTRNVENPVNLLFESVDDVIWFVNTDGIIKYISPSIKDFLGYEPDNLVDKRLSVILTKDSIDELNEGISKLGVDRNKLHYVYQYKTKAGIIKYGDVFVKQYSDRRLGDGYCATTRHISEEKSQSLVVNESELDNIKQELHDNKQENLILQNEVMELQRKIVKMSEVEDRKKPFPIESVVSSLQSIHDKISGDISKNSKRIMDATLRIANKYENTNMSKVDLEQYMKEAHLSSYKIRTESLKLAAYMDLFNIILNDKASSTGGKILVKNAIESVVNDLDLFLESNGTEIGLAITDEDYIKFNHDILKVIIRNLIIVYIERANQQKVKLNIEIKYIEEQEEYEIYIKSNVSLDIESIEIGKIHDFIEDNEDFSTKMRLRFIVEAVAKYNNIKFLYDNNESGSLSLFGFSKL